MQITTVVPDGHGRSRLDQGELDNSHPLSSALEIASSVAFASTGARFGSLPPGFEQGPHPAPHALFMIVLTGRVEIGTSTATKVLGPGDVLLANDTNTAGHTTRVVEGPAHALFVPVDQVERLVRSEGQLAGSGSARPDPAHLSGRAGRLAGKVAIVSGGGTSASPDAGVGVGRAIALTFGRAGAAVVIIDRDARAAHETLSAARAEGINALVVEADVASAAQCDRAVAAAAEAYGGVDVVVNNAAVVALGGAADTDLDEWDRVLAVNLTGAMLLTRSSVRQMLNHHGGSIINISSIAAVRGHGLAAYAAAKGGLESLTVDTAFTYGLKGIRANTVVVGSIDAPMSRRGGRNERADRMRSASNPMGVPGTGWDVANAALFFASDESRWVTGTTLPVDGGMLTTLPTTMFEALRAAAEEIAPEATVSG